MQADPMNGIRNDRRKYPILQHRLQSDINHSYIKYDNEHSTYSEFCLKKNPFQVNRITF